MEIRIREFRKSRGLTLQELADLVGTTAQTVQRLETSNMTVSTDWLERFASVFGVHPADLIKTEGQQTIELLGNLGIDGTLRRSTAVPAEAFALAVPGNDPVAVRLGYPVGPYASGSIVIANRLGSADSTNAFGADCLIALDGQEHILLRRVIAGRDKGVTLVPHTPGSDILYDRRPEWMARIVMTVQYI